jgi:cobalt-zinc-cadmium efflux system outer membrane protein
MRKFLALLLLTVGGCKAGPHATPPHLENTLATLTNPPSAPLEPVPPTLNPDRPLDLPALWELAQAYNPSLREAAADVEAARGRRVQAGLYPNPRVLYDQDTIGSRIARQGNFTVQMTQEVVTAGKRRLDMGVASVETDVAVLALLGRRFEVLTRIRRAYHTFVGWGILVRTSEEVVAALEQGARATRRLVEEAKTRPRTDLLRIEALLEEARIGLARSQANRAASWRQLAAEVGVPHLPASAVPADLPASSPQWDAVEVERRVLAVNASLKQAEAEAESARLALARARAQAIPNVTVGGGYNADNVDATAGGQVTVEAALPLWDRNQGNVLAARAHLARAEAAVGAAATRLSRDTAAAFANYDAARQQVERLTSRVLPRLQESEQQLRRGYQAGAPQVTFADVLQAEQALLTARLTLAEARRTLWLAIADLQGLMQMDVGEACER